MFISARDPYTIQSAASTMHPYSHTMFHADPARKDLEKKKSCKCLLFGSDMGNKKKILKHMLENEESISCWVVDNKTVRRDHLLSQYIAFHNPDCLVFLPGDSVNSCTHQLTRLVTMASQMKIQLVLLVRIKEFEINK